MVPYSYLDRQFADVEQYLAAIRQVVEAGDFTLGQPVREFEERFATLCGLPHAVGVGSGTDAIIMSLEMLGIGKGDEVITAPNTFIATVGAIVATGARPVFVDIDQEFNIRVDAIEAALTPRTKAIVPVHWGGTPADMFAIMDIATHHHLAVVEDAAQAILASINEKPVGSWGDAVAFSLHPLKNLNVWGDGGVIMTQSAEFAEKLRLHRNHGLTTRDDVEVFGRNSRLDSVQAAVGNVLIEQTEAITRQRIRNAGRYDAAFAQISDCIELPPRRAHVKQVYHLYLMMVEKRDELLRALNEDGIEAKVHYPIPLHLQKAAAALGYKAGDFPACERYCSKVLTLPVHQHLTEDEIDHVINAVVRFYRG
ncbi:MAG: hypothetical protein CMH81_07955 [Nitrospiraceae bacterium]|nr:hypothetical protein [Nitrospiraceae bacterium]|tara:strand:+ start:2498 stop:3598 length:1101 start_codon:yes stop_codon:yes gene_type:complete